MTRKSDLNAYFGYPVGDNPAYLPGMLCKEQADLCDYMVNVTDYEESVA